MPTHYGEMKSDRSTKKNMSMADMKKMSDTEYYKEHSKHHSTKHIKAMKALQKMGVNRDKAHSYVKKFIGK